MALSQQSSVLAPKKRVHDHVHPSARHRPLLNMHIGRRLAIGFLIPAVLAAFAIGGVASQSQLLLAHESAFYQSLVHAYATLNTDIDILEQMHTNLLGTLNDAGKIPPLHETLLGDQTLLRHLDTNFATALNTYRQQDVLDQNAELAEFFKSMGYGQQITQQHMLSDQLLSAWQSYHSFQAQVLFQALQENIAGAQWLETTGSEQGYADTMTGLLTLIKFNSDLIPSIRNALQSEENILLIILSFTIFWILFGMGIVAWLVFKTVVKRLHKVRSVITTIEDGQTEIRLPVEGDDEISTVSSSVNSMLDTIVGLLDESRHQRDELVKGEELKHLHEELQLQHEALNDANARLAALATTDPLTGLPNHRSVMNRIDEELSRCQRTQQSFALLFLDVDHFKRINDTWGHRAGDAILREVGSRLTKNLRTEDFAGRYGGEEFAILLTGVAEVEDARTTAERVRRSFADAPCSWENEESTAMISISVTISIGIALFREHGVIREALLEAADSAMYHAKHNGRNRVCVAGEERATVERLFETSQGQPAGEIVTLRALTAVANAHDHETGSHAQRVVFLAQETAHMLGSTEEETQLVRLAALLHDIGKVGIPNEILHKPGPLNEDEWQVMRRHPNIGHNILAQAGGKFEILSHIVVAHHERWDGGGYPYGLMHEMIPLGARILAVVDSFDAMTSDRPYRKALPEETARAELQRCAGNQYDPRVVAAFLQVLDGDKWKTTTQSHAEVPSDSVTTQG